MHAYTHELHLLQTVLVGPQTLVHEDEHSYNEHVPERPHGGEEKNEHPPAIGLVCCINDKNIAIVATVDEGLHAVRHENQVKEGTVRLCLRPH